MELSEIRGIGGARKKALEEAGIFDAKDLIDFFPYKYYDFSKTEPFSDDGNVKLIKIQVIDNPKIVKIRNGLSFVTCKVNDEIGHTFNAIWYNQTYIKSILFLGGEFYLYGKNSPSKKNTFIVSMCKELSKIQTPSFLPIYHSISGIGQKVLHDAINFCVENGEITEFTPNILLSKYNLINLKDAYYEVHNPTSEEQAERAFYRIEIENLIPLIAINEFNKQFYKVIKTQQYLNSMELKFEFEKLVPFLLTQDQKNAMYEIEKDMTSKFSMNRLLQGDVGSGKTIVSLFGAYLSAKNGYQSAIIAPTEILANQHFETASKLFEKLGIKVVLLTSSVKGASRSAILNEISNGTAQIIIGTHSVFSENVEFKNLSYIVIDEQHRFGVEQRAKLKAKGINADILVMSATPIPRSLSLVIYGDLELSTINSRPKPVNTITNIVSTQKQDDMWNYIGQKIKQGSKAYVVCSKIDEENENDSIVAFSAKSMYNFLLSKFSREEIGLIHGKLSKDTQNKLIEKFRMGIIKVLVSTTIVEVGMDIPDADIMVIATPERFGLATLHQLRGRIGRNGNEAHCFCLANNLNEKSYERIKFFKNNQNGFEIAEFDLKTRGAGSVLGTNQHGDDNGLLTKFSSSAYSVAKQILEHIKSNPTIYTEVLERGNKVYGKENLNKIILN